MGFFNWVRTSIKAAVLAGFQDAVTELATADANVEVPTLQLDYRPTDGVPEGTGQAKRLTRGR
jgi:hypothetical protein